MAMLSGNWQKLLKKEFSKEYYKYLFNAVSHNYTHCEGVYPKSDDIFRAFELCDPYDIKVVIVAAYRQDATSDGLLFSSNGEPSGAEKNLLIELEDSLHITRTNNSLEDWAKQGVLLLNTWLTFSNNPSAVRTQSSWELFTTAVIKALNKIDKPILVVSLGNVAHSVTACTEHDLIKLAHPSPLSAYRGFLGSGIFNQINKYLIDNNQGMIFW